jgi:hypothetical protein
MDDIDEVTQDWRWQPLREVAGGCLLAMELLVAVFWFSVVGRAYKPLNLAVVLIILGGIFAGGYLLERSSQNWKISPAKRRWVLLAVWILSLWAGLEVLVYYPQVPGPLAIATALFKGFADQNLVPLEFWTLVATMLVWGRSQALAHAPTDTDRVVSSFSLTMLSLLAYQFFPPRLPAEVLSWLIFGMVFFGLAAMGSVRIAILAEMRGGKQTLANRGWMAGLAASALLVSAVTALLVLVVKGPGGQIVIHAFAILIGIIGGLLTMLAYPIAHLVESIVYWLQGMIASMQQEGTPQTDPLGKFRNLFNIPQLESDALNPLLNMIKPVTLWGVLIIIALGVIFALGLQVYRERKRRLDSASTQLSTADILRDLGDAARQRARDLADDLLHRLRKLPGARYLQAVRIRMIYAEFMSLCNNLDHPRQGAVTPLEFLPEMAALLIGAEAELQTITYAYLRVRYGELPETSQEIQNVLAAWEKVKEAGKKAKKLPEQDKQP